MSALSTPAFLVDEGGILVFYNEAAGMLLGKRGRSWAPSGPQEWGALFGPFDESGEPIPYDELPLVVAVRNDRPAHGNFEIRSADGTRHRSRSPPSRSRPRTARAARSPSSGPPHRTDPGG